MGLFDQLETFSHRYFDSLKLTERTTPWTPGEFSRDPKGAILHYTADEDLDRVVRWFMRAKHKSRVSANYILADRKYSRTAEMIRDLPLVAALPVTVIQCARPEIATQHAGIFNSWTLGIELLNVGELRKKGDEFYSHWKRDHDPQAAPWTMVWKNPAKQPVPAWGRYWEPYTGSQLHALVTLLRELANLYPLSPSWILSHECIQENKRDPGPAFPINQVRASVFGADCGWTTEHSGYDGEDQRDLIVRQYAQTLTAKCAGNGTRVVTEMPTSSSAWARFHTGLVALESGADPFGAIGKTALALLGYWVPGFTSNTIVDFDKEAIWFFQRAMGLKPDRMPGRKTRAALLRRLKDRGILVP